MCERCHVYQSAFGSREPLPPRVASIHDGPLTKPLTASKQEISAPDAVERLRASDTSNREPQPSVVVSISSETAGFNSFNTHPSSDTKTSATSAVVSSSLRSMLDPVSAVTSTAPSTASSNATYTAVSSAITFNTYAKWSDVASLGFGAPGPKIIAKKPRDAIPRNVLVSMMEHSDMLDTLMQNCPDFPTLFALVTTCKTAKHAFELHPQGIIKAMLRTMSQELQHLTIALIGINGSYAGNSRAIQLLMETWLGMGSKPLTERLHRNPVEIVRKLANSFSAIDVFMDVIPKNCVNNFTDYKTILTSREGLDYNHINDLSIKHPLLNQTEWSDIPDDTEWDVPDLPAPGVGPQEISLPLVDQEMYRLKRALLRYELFCSLFYLGSDKQFDSRYNRNRYTLVPNVSRQRAYQISQAAFLKDYVNPWEIGELAVVSHFVYDLVRNAYFHKYKSLRYDFACDSYYGRWGNRNYGRNGHHDHEEVVDEFDSHMGWFASQGLTLLRKIYDDRNEGYQALVDKYCEPRSRLPDLFIPFEKCTNRQVYLPSDPSASWNAYHTWPDTPGLEKPSKGWAAKSPASDDTRDNDAYWGEKWMRKIGYFIWDRD